MISRLESLPDELLDGIFSRLTRAEQCSTALASWHCYHRVIPHLYRAIELVDCRNKATMDEHDDTPMIRILLVLAKNPYLASNVQDLTHRCQVSLPDAIRDLPRLSLLDLNLSKDARTLRLLSLAIQNLSNVNTLRIIYGHHHITIGILRGFFGTAQNRHRPVARLWLESCCLEGLFQGAGVNFLMGGLRTVRIRRLRLRTEMSTIGETFSSVRDRVGSVGMTGARRWDPTALPREITLEEYSQTAANLEEAIYESFPGVEGLVKPQDGVGHCMGDSTCQNKLYFPHEEPAWLVSQLVTTSSSTLTSLNLDWVLDIMPLISNDWINHATFQNLRAFQVRNNVTKETRFSLESTISLLEGDWLQFLERHPRIQCLAWPLEYFFHPTISPRLTSRAQDVVMTLGRTLKELRLDANVLFHEEPWTDEIDTDDRTPQRAGVRRRFFIEQIAPHLTTLEILKIEGGIPFDERSEIVRAVRFSPLRKLVVIGVSFPLIDACKIPSIGDRDYLVQSQPSLRASTHSDPSQDSPTATNLAMLQAHALFPSSPFVPTYNPSRYSMLDTIALHHASTITTLKFCGFKNAPDIHNRTSTLPDVLGPLRHFHNLQHLTLSLWMRTTGEHQGEHVYLDPEVRSYWVGSQSPTSTALAFPARAYHENPWAKVLVDDYAPVSLAHHVASLLAPRLSVRALARKGGVSVKALLLLAGHEIFDLEVRLDAHGEVASYRGPTSERDAERLREKMARRAWF